MFSHVSTRRNLPRTGWDLPDAEGSPQAQGVASQQGVAEPVAPPEQHSAAGASDTAAANAPVTESAKAFYPSACDTFEQTGLPEAFIEALLFRYLLATGSGTARQICTDLCLPGPPMVDMLTDFKTRQFLVYKNNSGSADFEYTLTDTGRERARRYLEECTYVGPAPVPIERYVESVGAQTITSEQPTREALERAFADLLINQNMFDQLGPAINSGRGLFLYGYPGNGKTSIAERITACFGSEIWIPQAIFVDGEIIQLLDPQVHDVVKVKVNPLLKGSAYDTRWVKIKRPTIVVGGELTMDALELKFNEQSRITEAATQLKSNCGTLVIDDFGRQRMEPIELLNRWIIPLEKRYDFLQLSNGKKIKVPFDQLIIFSTNLEPKQLVDDAFLRRIPYKINVNDPSEQEFRALLKIMAGKFSIAWNEAAVDHLMQHHYVAKGRPFRCCQPRDLLLQIINQAKYRNEQPLMTSEGFDRAAGNYFAVM